MIFNKDIGKKCIYKNVLMFSKLYSTFCLIVRFVDVKQTFFLIFLKSQGNYEFSQQNNVAPNLAAPAYTIGGLLPVLKGQAKIDFLS